MSKLSVTALPAARAAGPTAEKTPAPIIEPSPTAIASPTPSLRARRVGGAPFPLAAVIA
jgi:hypothetical protein